MKSLKIYALVLVLALGLIGGAYAIGWTDSVKLNATVDTGNVDVYWDVFEIRSSEDDPWHQPDARAVPDWMEADAWIEDNYKKAWLVIENLYPMGEAEEMVAVEAHIRNDSSIPVKLDDIELLFTKGEAEAADIGVKFTLGIMTPHESGYDWDPITDHPDYSVTTLADLDDALMAYLECVELEPGQLFTFGEDTLYFYLEGADAPQNAEVEFSLEFIFKQFNQ